MKGFILLLKVNQQQNIREKEVRRSIRGEKNFKFSEGRDRVLCILHCIRSGGLILIPDQTVNIICKVIFGLVMIAAGIYHIAIYAAEKEKARSWILFTGVIVLVLGVFLFFTPQIVVKILPYLLGAFVLVDSIWKLKGSIRLKKMEQGQWKVLLAGSIIFIILGGLILFFPFVSVPKMLLVCGCILTANGVADLVFLIILKVCLKKGKKRQLEKEETERGHRKKLVSSRKL